MLEEHYVKCSNAFIAARETGTPDAFNDAFKTTQKSTPIKQFEIKEFEMLKHGYTFHSDAAKAVIDATAVAKAAAKAAKLVKW